MTIYLAARYSRYPDMQRIADALRAQGHTITSRWIHGDHAVDEEGLSGEAACRERIRFAEEDLADLMAAVCIIAFTESPRSVPSRGGRHVEFGIALARRMRCIVVGPRENVFYCLPQVEQYDTRNALLEALGREEA